MTGGLSRVWVAMRLRHGSARRSVKGNPQIILLYGRPFSWASGSFVRKRLVDGCLHNYGLEDGEGRARRGHGRNGAARRPPASVSVESLPIFVFSFFGGDILELKEVVLFGTTQLGLGCGTSRDRPMLH